MVLGFSNSRSQDLPDRGRRAQVIPAGATMAESGWSATRTLAPNGLAGSAGGDSGRTVGPPRSRRAGLPRVG